MTDLEDHCSVFYREFYYDEVQTLLLSNEVSTTANGALTEMSPAKNASEGAAASPKARSPTTLARVATDASSIVSFTTDGSEASAGVTEPTRFEKLWAHVKKLAGEDGQTVANPAVTVCGSALHPIHSAGPPALSCNRTGTNCVQCWCKMYTIP